jgi:hypothetical protein
MRAHLDRLLRSSHFKNSRRCQALLTCVVEQALDGNAELLKERTVGVLAFGRDPAYDTNQDAVVRNVAMEVRKRLAQFYVESGHSDGIWIELPPGSYVPEFRTETVAPVVPEAPAQAGKGNRPWRRWVIGVAAVAVVGTAATVAVMRDREDESGRFWAPVAHAGGIVQICVGQPAELYSFRGPRKSELDRNFNVRSSEAGPQTISGPDIEPAARRYLWRRDAFCMAKLAGFLGSRGIPFRLRSESDAPYAELRGSPLVMIGAFDWRRQIRSSERRFGFGQAKIDGVDYKYVRDRKNPEDRQWKFPLVFTTREATEYDDYGIVTRELTSASEKAVISVVGATDYSTLAGGEFLSGPGYIRDALRSVHTGWEQQNVQIVIRTRIIQGVPGPPAAVAVHTW